MVKANLYEYWGFLVNDDWEVMIPEGAIPLTHIKPSESGYLKLRIACLVPKDVAIELEKDEDFVKKWGKGEAEGRSDVVAEIDKVVLEAENDPDIPEEEKEAIRGFASDVSKSMAELEELEKEMKEESS